MVASLIFATLLAVISLVMVVLLARRLSDVKLELRNEIREAKGELASDLRDMDGAFKENARKIRLLCPHVFNEMPEVFTPSPFASVPETVPYSTQRCSICGEVRHLLDEAEHWQLVRNLLGNEVQTVEHHLSEALRKANGVQEEKSCQE